MRKKLPTSGAQPQPSVRLVVRGERRPDPDWDTFIAALLAYALREPDDSADAPQERDD